MTLPVFIAGLPNVIPPLTAYAPNTVFQYTDYDQVTLTSTSATFSRSINDGQGLLWVNPGARVRFQTNATTVAIAFNYTQEIARTDIYNGQGLILVNGTLLDNFNIAAQGTYQQPESLNVLLSFTSATSRLIELVMPYGTSVTFNGVSVNVGATFGIPAPRSSTTYAAMGDSITQGLRVNTDVSYTWVYGIGLAHSYQIVNMGYGGRVCVSSDGTALGKIAATLYSYLIGENDFLAQEPLTGFSADYQAFIQNFRVLQSTAKLYCITPTPTTTVLAIPIESYRQQIRNVLTALNNPLNVLVEGGSLWPNNVTYSPDGIHPNNLGSASAVTALTSTLVP